METERGRTSGGVAYTVRGSGPPLLWLSGYVVPVAAFGRVLRRLAENHTVVAVDHRGSGASRTRPFPTTTGTMAIDALSVLDKLGVRSAHVVGTSLGGMVAQELAISWPHRVRSLVLCSTTAGGPGVKTPPGLGIVRELGRAASSVAGGQRFRVRAWGTLHQAAAASSHDATRRLHRIQAPTLVLHGGADDLVPVANATWLAARIPGAELRVIRGGNHMLVLESAVARKVLQTWLDEHRGKRAAARRPSTVAWLACAPYRILLGQTVPLRRALRAGSQLGHPPSPQ